MKEEEREVAACREGQLHQGLAEPGSSGVSPSHLAGAQGPSALPPSRADSAYFEIDTAFKYGSSPRRLLQQCCMYLSVTFFFGIL